MDAGLIVNTESTESDFEFADQQDRILQSAIGGSGKRVFDCTIAVLVLFILLPLIVFIAFMVWQHDRHSPFFGHKRVGRNGQAFKCWKFRSMLPDSADVLMAHLAAHPDAAREWTETQKLRDDPRVTPIGRLLRISSLDELPQLFNVLMGHMSLVGPRPIVADEVSRYGTHFKHYAACRPGLTGMWQVSGRSDTSYAERVRFDTHYAQGWSFRRDALIVVRTVPVLLNRKGSY